MRPRRPRAPVQGTVGDALDMVGRPWTDGPRVLDAADRMHTRSSGGLELRETGLETIGRRAGIVRGRPARATGFPLKMRERAGERWLANLT